MERELAEERVKQFDLPPAKSTNKAATRSTNVRDLEQNIDRLKFNVHQLELSLDQRTTALDTAEKRITAMKRERHTHTDELREFERDLKAQQQENADFGVALKRFKDEQHGSVARNQIEIEALRKDLTRAREQLRRSEDAVQTHQKDYDAIRRWRDMQECGVSSQVVDDQKVKFKAQSRELATQVRYLKAKFTREATFRNALAIQKRYLLLLVGGYSLK